MNKRLDWIGGIWLLLNMPVIPFVGSIFYSLPAIVHVLVAVVVLSAFALLSKTLSASVVASICVVAISLLRTEQVQNYLHSVGVDSVTSSLVIVIIVALIAVGVTAYSIVKAKRLK